MKIRQLVSFLVTTAIMAQNIVFAYSFDTYKNDKYTEKVVSEEHHIVEEDIPKNDFYEFNAKQTPTNHRKIINPKVEKYSMEIPKGDEVRVIATYKSEKNKNNYENGKSKAGFGEKRELSNNQTVLNVDKATLDEMLSDVNIKNVENDHLVYKNSIPYTKDSSFVDVGVMIGNYYPGSFDSIGIAEYHNDGTYGEGVKIAIFDTGLNVKSTELNVCGGVTFVDESDSFADDNGHGTAMAGIIGAAMDNEGITGIAPNAELYSVKVLNEDGIGYVSSVIQGIAWAIENDMDIIYFGFSTSDYSYALETSVRDAYDNGILMIAPAGNEGAIDICYPAGYGGVISVGSVNDTNEISDFSNNGADVYAPGENIESILYINNKPTLVSGTSVSAAHVTGMVALLLDENDTLSTQDVLNYFENSDNSGFKVLLSDITTSEFVGIANETNNLRSYEELILVNEKNSEMINTLSIESEEILLNRWYADSFNFMGEKHYYKVKLPNHNQKVTFKISFDDAECEIYYIDEYNGLTYNVTNQSIILQSGYCSFYVYCIGEGAGIFGYTMRIDSSPYDNVISETTAGHYVDETTGNFSYTFDDIKTKIAGQDFIIQRRYNSNDLTDNHFNRGFTFNYECKAAYSTTVYINENGEQFTDNNPNVISFTIPDGTVLYFEKIVGEYSYVFQPRNSRATMECEEVDLTTDITITMPDQTKYHYNPLGDYVDSPGCLYMIEDKYGNIIDIFVYDSKIIEISDVLGNRYFFRYEGQGKDKKVKSISDDFGRTVTYGYSGNKLIESVDSAGIRYSYTYDADGLLTEIKNDKDAVLAKVTYEDYGRDICKVKTLTDKFGSVYEYGYDTINYKTTIREVLDSGTERTTTTGYDIERDITYYKDAAGRPSIIEFYYQETASSWGVDPDGDIGIVVDEFYYQWKNGQILNYQDETGAITQYDYPSPMDNNYLGLPTSKTVKRQVNGIYELLEYSEYEYDEYGNIILEMNWIDKPETGVGSYKATRYIYDDEGKYLYKKAEYLPVLTTRDVPKLNYNLDDYAVTCYEYDKKTSIKGLVSKITYPEQYTGSTADKGWVYEYDYNGNCISVINPESTSDNVIKEMYEYNDFGWVSKHISGEGNITEYEYDNNGNEIKRTVNSSDVYRTVYNSLGLPVQKIEPNQYNSAYENENGNYDDASVGIKYEYSSNGLMIKETDAEGYITKYSYDKYGNISSKILPNGGVYNYHYDEIDNLTDTYYSASVENQPRCIRNNAHSTKDGLIAITFRNINTLGEYISGHYLVYDPYGKLLKACDMMVPNADAFYEASYDLMGNLKYEENRHTNDAWNVTFFKSNLFDENTSRLYEEKYISNQFYPTDFDEVNVHTYKYEKTMYDKNGNIIQTVASSGIENETPTLTESELVIETTEYYADNLVKSKTDALGVKTEYEYDKDRVVSKITITAPGKEPTVISYENNHYGKPVTVKTYLSPERLTDSENLLEDSFGYYSLTTNTYDKNGNLIKQIPSTGATTEFTYNNRNLQTSVTLSASGENTVSMTESCSYDDMGNVTEQIDKNGNVTKFIYNQRGYLTYTIYPNNKTSFNVHDNHGRLLAEVEAVDYTGNVSLENANLNEYTTDFANLGNMNRTVYTYDQDDNVLTATKYVYNEDSDTWTSFVKTTNTYDRQKRLLTTTDALGNTVEYEYDVHGNCIKYVDPTKHNTGGFTTSYEYDMLGRKIKESNSYGDYYSYTYDKKGNLTDVRLTANGITETISSYTYDESGKTLTQTDGNGHTTTLVYDDNNFLASQYAHGGENDSTKTDSYKFDSRGNLVEHTDRNGNTTVNTYDDFNRLISTVCGDETVSYTYDNNGNVLTMTDASGITTYTYDSMGRILTQNHSVTGTISYSYDNYADVPYGLVAETTTDPKGNTVEKWYDADDKIYKVVDNSNVTEYNYYNNDRVYQVKTPNGLTTTYTYDAEGNLLTLVTTDSNGAVVDSFTYTYSDDTLGYKNQVSKTEKVNGISVGTTTYEYDGQSRLTKAVHPNGVQNIYTYDDAGNRLTKTSTSGNVSAVTEYTYDEQNRLLQTKAYVVGDTTEAYTYFGYDNNGNQIAKWTQTVSTTGTEDAVTLSELGVNAGDETALYEFDNFNRLVGISQGDTVIENVYNGAGKKTSRTTDGETTYYVYDGNTVILELDDEKSEAAQNVYGRSLISREMPQRYGVMRYNGHGDVIRVETVGTTATYHYDEFGNSLTNDVSPLLEMDFTVESADPVTYTYNNPYRYAGYEYIEEVKLYDLNARYYNPEIARFLSADPYYNLGNRVIGLYEINVPSAASIMQANNLYVYCGNAPVVYIDPSGEIAITTIILIGSIVVGTVAAGYTAYQSHKYTGKIDWEATIINGLSWGMMAYTMGMSAYAVYVDYCHYYGKTPVSEVKFNSGASISTGNKMTSGTSYTGTRNPSADFKNGTKLTQHYNDHGKSMGFSNEIDYSKAASNFLTKKATDTTVSFKTSNGTYFRYDTATNEFGIMNQYGGVSTYYYPEEGIDYWLKQVEKYSNT